MPTSTERLVETNGVALRVIEAGERGAPVVVLAHGFPGIGLFVAPPDPGAGGGRLPRTGAGPTRLRRLQPTGDFEDYDIHALTGDLVGLLDDVGAQQAVFIGHDWGAMVVWHTALLHPGTRPGRRGPQRATDPPDPIPPDRTLAAEVRRRLLHAALPRARPSRRRDGRRRGRHHDAVFAGLLGGSGDRCRTGSAPRSSSIT